jgi:hypothetical protein
MMLPPGAPTVVEVRIRDAWGGTAAVRLAVNVSGIDSSAWSAIGMGAVSRAALDALAQATCVGDMNAAAQVCETSRSSESQSKYASSSSLLHFT